MSTKSKSPQKSCFGCSSWFNAYIFERNNSTNYPLGTAIWNSHIKQSYTRRTPKKGSRSQINESLPFFGQFVFFVANLCTFCNTFKGLNNDVVAKKWQISGLSATLWHHCWIYISLTLKMPEINGAKAQWNKQNIIRLALISGMKYPN